jgi:hypothetical protein
MKRALYRSFVVPMMSRAQRWEAHGFLKIFEDLE